MINTNLLKPLTAISLNRVSTSEVAPRIVALTLLAYALLSPFTFCLMGRNSCFLLF